MKTEKRAVYICNLCMVYAGNLSEKELRIEANYRYQNETKPEEKIKNRIERIIEGSFCIRPTLLENWYTHMHKKYKKSVGIKPLGKCDQCGEEKTRTYRHSLIVEKTSNAFWEKK